MTKLFHILTLKYYLRPSSYPSTMASEMGKIDNEFLIEYFKDRGLDNISSAEPDGVRKIQECNMTQVCCKTSPTLMYGEYHSQLVLPWLS